MLPFDVLVRTSGRAAALCERACVDLSDQMDYGGAIGEQFNRWFAEGRQSVQPAREKAPAERPGEGPAPDATAAPEALPAPLPPLGTATPPLCTEPWRMLYILRRGVFPCCYGGPIAPMTDYRKAWNSDLMKGIRRELASGRFHDYCLESEACPIVRKARHGTHAPAVAARRRPRGVRARATWVAARARRVLTEPAYAATQARRLWRAVAGPRQA